MAIVQTEHGLLDEVNGRLDKQNIKRRSISGDRLEENTVGLDEIDGDIVGSIPDGYVEPIGNTVDQDFTVTHNLGSRQLIIQVYRTGSPYDEVHPDKERSTLNEAIIRFPAIVPTHDEFTVVILKPGV